MPTNAAIRPAAIAAAAADTLENRTLLSSVSVVGAELRIDGTNAESNNFTIDYDAGGDTYTITDTNALTAGAGAVQVDPNTVTVDGTQVNEWLRIRARDSTTGTNTIAINADGGSGWGDEGLRVEDQPSPTEIITVGAGGIAVQSGAIRSDVSLLGDTVLLQGDITTAEGNIALNSNNDGGTIDVVGPVVLTPGSGKDVNLNGAVVSATGSDLTATGNNVFFDASVTGLGSLSVTAESRARVEGDLSADTAFLQGETFAEVAGVASGEVLTFNSRVIQVDSIDVTDQLTLQGGAFDIGTIAGNGSATAVLQSRVEGNGITVFNQPAAPTDTDSGSFDLTTLDRFADFSDLIIGGPQVDASGEFSGLNAASIDLVADFDPATRLMFPIETTLIADTINMNEGLTVETDDGANAVSFLAETVNQNNPFAFAGDGTLEISSLSAFDSALSEDLTVNGRLQARPRPRTDPAPDLLLGADDTLTTTGEFGNFASIFASAETADFQHPTATTSQGDLTVVADTLLSNGGLTADGNILVDGDFELTFRNLLFSRGGGDITVNGEVIGNGFDLFVQGNKNGANAGTVTFDGDIAGIGRFVVNRTDNVTLGGTLTANGGSSGSDININIAGLLKIGGDITAPGPIDIKTDEIDLIGDEDHTINSTGDTRVQLVGDLVGTGTLTVDVLDGLYVRVGDNGAVTVNVV